MYIISMFIHLNQLQTKNKLRLNESNQMIFIRTSNKRIKHKLKIKIKCKQKTIEMSKKRKQI